MECRHRYLYRVLRPDENPSKGLYPASKYSTSSVRDHVAYGSKSRSQYISTCADKYTARQFAKLGMERRHVSSKKIVTINVNSLKSVPGVRIIDLTDYHVRRGHSVDDNKRSSIFSRQWKEVLVEGYIPDWCITEVEQVSLQFGALDVKVLKHETQAQIRDREEREERERTNYWQENQLFFQLSRQREEREREKTLAEERERQRQRENERRQRLYAEQLRQKEEKRRQNDSCCTIL